MKHAERQDAERLLAHKRRVDAERRRTAFAKKVANNIAAMHRVTNSVK